MRLTWPQHLATARTLELTGDAQRGEAMALMGIAMLMLAQDLLEEDAPSSSVARQNPPA